MGKTLNPRKLTIINRKIDFYKIKINDDLLKYIEDKSYRIYNNLTFRDFKLDEFDWLVLFDKFIIVNFGTIWNTKQRFDILDFDLNKVWNIIYALVDYKSNISYLELSWLFCNSYMDYKEDFFKFLHINTKINWILKKIDFKIDVVGKETFQIIQFMKDKDYKNALVEWLSAFDKKKVLDTKGLIKYWKVITWLTIKGTYNNLVIYDKILDILDNYLSRQIDWVNPYQEYLDSNLPITRIEVSKKWESFQHIANNSIDWIEKNIEALYFDYLKGFFVVDFRKICIWTIESLNGKTNFIAKKQKELKLIHSLNMFQAYGRNLKYLLWQSGFEKETFKYFPELENRNILDYTDNIDIKDYFDNISDYIYPF